jgi:hypothetical protein
VPLPLVLTRRQDKSRKSLQLLKQLTDLIGSQQFGGTGPLMAVREKKLGHENPPIRTLVQNNVYRSNRRLKMRRRHRQSRVLQPVINGSGTAQSFSPPGS